MPVKIFFGGVKEKQMTSESNAMRLFIQSLATGVSFNPCRQR